jgi:signal transduction histidine kinase
MLLNSYKIILFSILFPIATLQSQPIERFNSFRYNVNEGLLQSTISDMAFDQNNFCWISFPNGIQKFDGKIFNTIPVQPGLPDDKYALFFRCSNGDLLISHSLGISKYEISSNRFTQVYNNRFSSVPAKFIGLDENIIYIFTSAGKITGLDSHTFKVISETNIALKDHSSNTVFSPRISENIINHKVALLIDYTLYLWDLKQGNLVFYSRAFPDASGYFLKLKGEYEVLFYDYKINNALQLYNFTTKTKSLIVVKGKDDKEISRCIIYKWHDKTLISFSNKLYEADVNLLSLKSELVNFQNQPIAFASAIVKIKEDNYGNLYLQTVSDGIIKIIRNNYLIKYYGLGNKEDNFIHSLLPDKKSNRILAGTGKGILVFDTLQQIIKHIKTLPGSTVNFTPNTIIKNNEGDYLLFCVGLKNVWRLKNDLSELNRMPISTSLPERVSGIDYFGNPLFQSEKELITQSQGMLYRTSFVDNTVTEHEFTKSYTLSGLMHNSSIISHANDELIFMDAATFNKVKTIQFPHTGGVRCFTRNGNNQIYMGSNKGIFIIDSSGKLIDHLDKNIGLPDECIYAMTFDNEGNLWCSTNKGIFKLNKDNSILQLKKEDGLQENEFNTNVSAKSEDGELFFGGVNGISSFYPSAISSYEEKINILITKIRINNEEAFVDTAVWNIDKIKLPYHQNTLAFDFVAMANNNPGQYIYQYKMVGIDDQWIRNNELQTVRYFLPPGNYVLQIFASRYFDNDAVPMKEIVINIEPPFWKTWWFTTCLAVLLISAMINATNQYNKKKYQIKLAVIESEHKLLLERQRISLELHDSIGAYANAVLYNTELLEKEHNKELKEMLMQDLKFASKDIIISLRETIWALKKDKYTAEDCLMRIRNFIQPLARYYKHIHFKIEGEASVEKQLHYVEALNVVRIVQEAVTNAIKHSNASIIKIESLENSGKWQLTVLDNGIGYGEEAINQTEDGNGLNNMEKRAADAGFGLVRKSDAGSGTSITIMIY